MENAENWRIYERFPHNQSKKRDDVHKFGAICAVFLCLVSWFDVVLEELDDVFCGGAGQEDFRDALFLQSWQIFLWNDAADEDEDVVHPFFTKQSNDTRAEGVVCATEDRDADRVHVFL